VAHPPALQPVTLDITDNGFTIRLVVEHPSPEGADMLPTLRDRPVAPRHEGLLAAAGHRQAAMSTWARAALDRSEKLLTLCAPVDTDITSRAGSGLTALTPEDLHSTAAPAELLQRALPDGDHGLGILVWADAVITATSRATHEEIETTLAHLCRDHPVSVLCVYDRAGKREGAGIEHLDLAVARHPDGLQGQCLALRRTADTLYVDGEIDMSNLDVFATALHALTDTPSPTVCIDLNAVRFLAAAGVRTLIRDTGPYRDRGADVEIHATPHITRVLQLLDIHRLPQLHLSCRGVPANTR
jgi:anti-anti-sigma factor